MQYCNKVKCHCLTFILYNVNLLLAIKAVIFLAAHTINFIKFSWKGWQLIQLVALTDAPAKHGNQVPLLHPRTAHHVVMQFRLELRWDEQVDFPLCWSILQIINFSPRTNLFTLPANIYIFQYHLDKILSMQTSQREKMLDMTVDIELLSSLYHR